MDHGPRWPDAAMEYCRIEVRLLDVKPAPWRQFLIKKAATFERLHMAIQDSCGWTNSHLYSFTETDKGSVIATIPDDDLAVHEPDAKKVKLSAFLPDTGAKRFFYQYDFGESWWHEVKVLDVVSMPQRFVSPAARRGARVFPRGQRRDPGLRELRRGRPGQGDG